MSILNFSEDKYIKTFDENEEIRMGGVQLDTGKGGTLGNIRVFMYINDFSLLTGTEQMTIKIYTSPKYENTLITSKTINLSDIEIDTSDPLKTNYLGYVRFDFNNEWLNENLTYYPTTEINGYVPNGDLFYIGLAYDYPDPVYDNGGAYFHDQSIAMQIFTRQQRTV